LLLGGLTFVHLIYSYQSTVLSKRVRNANDACQATSLDEIGSKKFFIQACVAATVPGIARAIAMGNPISQQLLDNQEQQGQAIAAVQQTLVQQGQAIAAIQQTLVQQDLANQVRIFNSRAANDESIIRSISVNGNTPADFPNTRGELIGLLAAAVDALLLFYGLPTDGLLPDRKERLSFYLGMRWRENGKREWRVKIEQAVIAKISNHTVEELEEGVMYEGEEDNQVQPLSVVKLTKLKILHFFT
jgi:hypothetical protein